MATERAARFSNGSAITTTRPDRRGGRLNGWWEGRWNGHREGRLNGRRERRAGFWQNRAGPLESRAGPWQSRRNGWQENHRSVRRERRLNDQQLGRRPGRGELAPRPDRLRLSTRNEEPCPCPHHQAVTHSP